MLRILITVAALTAMNYAQAQDPKLTAQQEKMRTCNHTASERNLKGDERRSFMSECLRADRGEKLTVQQQKMQSCNKEASSKDLKGDKRRDFMSDCLKAS